jgi:hypothetical protein
MLSSRLRITEAKEGTQMANESPFTPGSWTEGAPFTGRRAADGPNYWANPPTGPQESELYPTPETAPAPEPSPLAWTPTVVADPVDEPAIDELPVDEPVAETVVAAPAIETVVETPVVEAPVVEAPVADEPVIDLRATDEPAVPAFVNTERRPYNPAPAPVIDHASETHAVGEYDSDEFREVANPARGGLFARYTPPVTEPLPQTRSDRKKRRHGLRSRH